MATRPEHVPSPTNDLLKHFVFEHLPAHLQDVSRHFADLAHRVHHTLPAGPETDMAMRKLLEAKDCAVRSARDLG